MKVFYSSPALWLSIYNFMKWEKLHGMIKWSNAKKCIFCHLRGIISTSNMSKDMLYVEFYNWSVPQNIIGKIGCSMIINHSFTGGKIAVIPAEENPVFWTLDLGMDSMDSNQISEQSKPSPPLHHHTKTPPTLHHIVWPFTFDICWTFTPQIKGVFASASMLFGKYMSSGKWKSYWKRHPTTFSGVMVIPHLKMSKNANVGDEWKGTTLNSKNLY